MNKPRILICPLNWGLGHASRCIPVIRALLEAGAEPILAADEGPLDLLQTEFPQLEWLHFPGVLVRYPEPGESMVWSMRSHKSIGPAQRHKVVNGLREKIGKRLQCTGHYFG